MSLFARFFRLVWGGEVDRVLRPVLAVALAGSVAGSSLFTFMGIWAIRELDASGRQLGAAGFALAPFFGLQVRDGFGDGAMWGMFAGFSVLAAVLGAIACRGVRSRSASEGLEPAMAS